MSAFWVRKVQSKLYPPKSSASDGIWPCLLVRSLIAVNVEHEHRLSFGLTSITVSFPAIARRQSHKFSHEPSPMDRRIGINPIIRRLKVLYGAVAWGQCSALVFQPRSLDFVTLWRRALRKWCARICILSSEHTKTRLWRQQWVNWALRLLISPLRW